MNLSIKRILTALVLQAMLGAPLMAAEPHKYPAPPKLDAVQMAYLRKAHPEMVAALESALRDARLHAVMTARNDIRSR